MSIVLVWLLIGGCLLVLSGSLFEHQQRKRHRASQRSPAQVELEAMRATARIRSMANAAEDYMDVFIQRRQAELRHQQRWWPSD